MREIVNVHSPAPRHPYVTPSVSSDDPRALRAIDGWLGMYEACYVLARCFAEGLTVADDAPTYGMQSAQRPQPAHLLAALIQSAAALNEWNGYWVLGGGLALNFHGRERATRDIDFFLLADKDHLDQVFAALAQKGVRAHTIEKPSFMPPDAAFWWAPLQFGVPDGPPVDVDLLVAPHEFMAFLHTTGIETRVNGVRIRVLGFEALLILKLKAWRDQDKADAQSLLRARRTFDRELVLAWLNTFSIGNRLPEMEAVANANDGKRLG